MGYTHSWNCNRDFTNDEWTRICGAFRTMQANLPAHSTSAGGYYDDAPLELADGFGEGEPVVTDYEIVFNGKRDERDLDHEGFVLYRKAKQAVAVERSCKTSRKPYDLIVCALLLAISEIALGALTLRSDGNMKVNSADWQPARDYLKSLTAKVVADEHS